MKTIKTAVVLAALFAASGAFAQIQGVITTPEGRAIKGTIKWKNAGKTYVVVQSGQNVEMEMPPEKIAKIDVPEPAGLKGAIANVEGGSATAAIPVLQKIITDYSHLNWDAVATRWLAEAQLRGGNAKEARIVCEKVIADDPDKAYLGEVAPVYWEALVKCDRASKAEELMAKAIKSGDRRSSAFALIRRGDLILAPGETQETARKALRDAYLRIPTLYRDVKDAQPEALYKAAQCFAKIGQSARADAFRTQLKKDYAASPWAKK